MSILFHLKMVTSLNNHQFLGHGHSCKLYPLIEPWAVTAIALPQQTLAHSSSKANEEDVHSKRTHVAQSLQE